MYIWGARGFPTPALVQRPTASHLTAPVSGKIIACLSDECILHHSPFSTENRWSSALIV